MTKRIRPPWKIAHSIDHLQQECLRNSNHYLSQVGEATSGEDYRRYCIWRDLAVACGNASYRVRDLIRLDHLEREAIEKLAEQDVRGKR